MLACVPCRLQLIAHQVQRGQRPSLPPDTPQGFKAVVEDCWRQDPASRPGFTEVLHRLREVQRSVTQLPAPPPPQQQQRSRSGSSSEGGASNGPAAVAPRTGGLSRAITLGQVLGEGSFGKVYAGVRGAGAGPGGPHWAQSVEQQALKGG